MNEWKLEIDTKKIYKQDIYSSQYNLHHKLLIKPQIHKQNQWEGWCCAVSFESFSIFGVKVVAAKRKASSKWVSVAVGYTEVILAYFTFFMVTKNLVMHFSVIKEEKKFFLKK